MDFGEILDKWEKMQKSQGKAKNRTESNVSRKKANAGSVEKSAEQLMQEQMSQKINPMELWLRRYGTVDKDALEEKSRQSEQMRDREYLKRMKPEARIDLHGLTRDEAWSRLENFVQDCLRRGLKKIEIVHGKGIHSHGSDPVLGQMVRTFIEQNKHLGTSGHNDRNHGGTGATWVLLK